MFKIICWQWWWSQRHWTRQHLPFVIDSLNGDCYRGSHRITVLVLWNYNKKNLIKYIIPDLIATIETLCVHVCRGLCVSVHMYKCMCVCFIYYNQPLRFLEIKQPQVKFYCFWFLVTQRDNNILSHSSLCLQFFLKKRWGNCVDSFKISLRFSFTNAYSDLTSRGSQFPAGSTVQWGLSRAIWGLFHNTASIRPLPCCASPQKSQDSSVWLSWFAGSSPSCLLHLCSPCPMG